MCINPLSFNLRECISCWSFDPIIQSTIIKDECHYIELSIRECQDQKYNGLVLRIAWMNYHKEHHWYLGPPSWLCGCCAMRTIENEKINWTNYDTDDTINMPPLIIEGNNLLNKFLKLKAFL